MSVMFGWLDCSLPARLSLVLQGLGRWSSGYTHQNGCERREFRNYGAALPSPADTTRNPTTTRERARATCKLAALHCTVPLECNSKWKWLRMKGTRGELCPLQAWRFVQQHREEAPVGSGIGLGGMREDARTGGGKE